MKTVIFISTTKSGSPRDAIKVADELNYYTILITDNKRHILKRDEYPDIHRMIYVKKLNFKTIKKVIDKFKNLRVSTIVSFVDGYVTLASRLRDHYEINNQNTSALEIMENKLKTRVAFKDEKFTPKFISSEDLQYGLDHIEFPMIYKKIDSTASKGVKLIDSIYEIKSRDPFILEEYLIGEQYLIEVYVKDSKIVNTVKIRQYLSKDTFIIIGYEIDIENCLTIDERHMIEKIVEKLSFKNGAFHVEYKDTKDGVKLIEINPRCAGGGMNDLLKIATGRDYMKEIMKEYLDLDSDFDFDILNNTFSYYLTTQKTGIVQKVTGRARARRIKGVKYIYIKPRKENKIFKPRSMGHRLGYIITTGDSIEEAINIALKAGKEIEFILRED